MKELEELKAMQAIFRDGLEKLSLLKTYLADTKARNALDIEIEKVNERDGVLNFWFAGTKYYVKARITDRNIDDRGLEDDIGLEYRVPIGWLDWGGYNSRDQREIPEQSDYYDDRGILCNLDQEEFYCSLQPGDNRLEKVLLQKLQRLVGKTVAMNNSRSA